MDTTLIPAVTLENHVISSGYDRVTCWAQARCAAIGNGGPLVTTLQPSIMASEDHVHDIFGGISMMRSEDGGKSWSAPIAQPTLARWQAGDGIEGVACDFTPQFHAASGRLLGIGVSSYYREGRSIGMKRRESVYSVFDASRNRWGPLGFLDMPGYPFAGAGCVQWVELENGDLLLPMAAIAPGCREIVFSSVVARCRFDGERLEIAELGKPLELPVERGLVEPSLIACGGGFWLTLRNDLGCYQARSQDGLHFGALERWRFDDGEPLASLNTQQHWLRLGERLFLVYTREGLENDHVVRHRAPLLMAEVDLSNGTLLRASERVVVPNRGAQLGNFGVNQGREGEAWICAAEWMENAGAWHKGVWSALEARFPETDLPTLAKSPGRCRLCELSGSDNSIHLVRVSSAPSTH